MNESKIEKKLREAVIKAGGLCYKFVSPGSTGVPDRIVIAPEGKVYFVELKTATGAVSAMQRYQIREMRRHGVDARVLRGLEEVDEFLREVLPKEGGGDR